MPLNRSTYKTYYYKSNDIINFGKFVYELN